MEENNKRKMSKRNMKLYGQYKKISFDYIFFYTINFLFLTQVKNINPADVVLIDSFYYLFSTIMQIPATFIIEFLGKKNSIIFANVINCLYIVIIIFSANLFNLIIAELLSSLAFAIKESAEPSLLSESIPQTKNKGKIFAKINQKGLSSYYIINAVTTVIAGFLYEINPYCPLILSLCVLIIVLLMSIAFIEPVDKKKIKKIKTTSELENVKDSIKFILKSDRVKSLILYSAVLIGIISILANYEVSLLEDLEISAFNLGVIFAVLGIVAGIATKKQEDFHNKFKNKSLSIIGFSMIISCVVAGLSGIIAVENRTMIIFIIIAYFIVHIAKGLYYALIEKYLSNFTDERIDTKIFTANNLIKSISAAFIGIMASFLLDRMSTAYCLLIIGCVFFVIMVLVCKYMKTRVGLDVNQYSKEEIKYDKIKN